MPDSLTDLGTLLRSWRDRLQPADVGLPVYGFRRAPGLKREELARLAGMSVDYLVRLEQGRARRPSAQVASALARALQLSDTERAHLFVISGLLPPGPGMVPTHIPPGVQRLVARLGEVPVAVFTASWDLLAWSPLWTALLGEPVQSGERRPNVLWAQFTGHFVGSNEVRIVDPAGGLENFKASLVSDLRRVYGRYPEDPGVQKLVAELTAASAEFRRLWDSGTVSEHQSEVKVVRNPAVGDVQVDCDIFSVAGTDLRIVAYTAAMGSEAAEKLDFLRVAGVTAAAPDHPPRVGV
ncbi:helix-turn-helix transcriptional regulator [Arthrobacter sp. zg-Y877]|uniref:helix-turn-helix transcriptional regulator n=1 Tax=Arthrobacter sp. zg-Y877 TaxID=3049074 RepID=UPI0025A44CE0|nr:helix-turn-helix transcriptional regulator [Arthrobacter sp. zg-Y877]MDM7991547.1 helix-turn-helix transcriptional regulator [Arthrobacter sp. zg-Y877]